MQRKIPFQQFDMLNPEGMPIGQPDVALTVHALEQLGENFHEFIKWLKAMKFKKAIHIEPIYELYDPYNIVDRLAMMWHDKRGYLKGLPNAITPTKVYRTWIGGMMHEAYSVVEWYPS